MNFNIPKQSKNGVDRAKYFTPQIPPHRSNMTIMIGTDRAFMPLCSLMLLLIATTSGINAAIVGIPDPGLRSAIKAELGLPDNLEITDGDMEGLIELKSNIPGIESLEGLASAPNIGLIALSECSIADISVLEGLPHLKTLKLIGNQATALTLPPGLQSLDSLDLRSSRTEIVTIPVALPKLRTFKLANVTVHGAGNKDGGEFFENEAVTASIK